MVHDTENDNLFVEDAFLGNCSITSFKSWFDQFSSSKIHGALEMIQNTKEYFSKGYSSIHSMFIIITWLEVNPD